MHDFETRMLRLETTEIAYLREGEGGRPLLLIHGWPETMRIWWRNIEPLAEAGFEVIVPDLRGFGDSGLAADDRYDAAAHARDMEALVRGELGHERVTVCAGDLGGVVAQDLSLRFEGLVDRLVLFNTVPPVLPGGPREVAREVRMAADYFLRHAHDADGLAAELDTPEKRRRYVAQFYGSRFWAAPGTFDREDVDFMTEPFADAERFRASIANYEYAGGPRKSPEWIHITEVEPDTDADPLRPRGPRDPARLHGAHGGRVPRPGGPVRGGGRRPLPPVGARRRAERRAALAGCPG